MAFSTSNVQVCYAPPLKILLGDWSGAVGDAAGSVSIAGQFVGSIWFKNDSTSVNQNTSQIFPKVEWNGSNPGTITVENQDNVTTGSFLIFTRGN